MKGLSGLMSIKGGVGAGGNYKLRLVAGGNVEC